MDPPPNIPSKESAERLRQMFRRAAELASSAVEKDQKGDLDAAKDLYAEATEQLIKCMKLETNPQRLKEFRGKANDYLNRAETLKKAKGHPDTELSRKVEALRNATGTAITKKTGHVNTEATEIWRQAVTAVKQAIEDDKNARTEKAVDQYYVAAQLLLRYLELKGKDFGNSDRRVVFSKVTEYMDRVAAIKRANRQHAHQGNSAAAGRRTGSNAPRTRDRFGFVVSDADTDKIWHQQEYFNRIGNTVEAKDFHQRLLTALNEYQHGGCNGRLVLPTKMEMDIAMHGLPDSTRRDVWFAVSGAAEMRASAANYASGSVGTAGTQSPIRNWLGGGAKQLEIDPRMDHRPYSVMLNLAFPPKKEVADSVTPVSTNSPLLCPPAVDGSPTTQTATPLPLPDPDQSDSERGPVKHTRDSAGTIEVDLHRTFPSCSKFELTSEQNWIYKLRNVLRAYAMRNPSGYCQSMNFLVGVLLLISDGDEEFAFWMLAVMVERNTFNADYYTESMAGCALDQEVLQKLVHAHVPSLFQNPDKEFEFSVAIQMDALQWLLCVYVNSMPFEAVIRVWDLYFVQGTVLLLRLAIVILKRQESALLKCNDMAGFLETTRKWIKRVDGVHSLLQQTFEKPFSSLDKKSLEKLRTSCRASMQSTTPTSS